MIWGVDISGWQAGIDLAQVQREGFAAVIIKATEGSGYTSPAYVEQRDAARAAGLRVMAYHYVLASSSPAEQVDRYARVEPDRSVPVMLDHEQRSGDAGVLRAVHDEFVRRGYRVALVYLPRWYWDGIGRPDLSGLPPLMASHYGADQPGYASALYPGDTSPGWAPYGGNAPIVLQFTQRARVAGLQIDAWAFRGDLAALDALFAAPTQEVPTMSDAQAVATQLLGGDRKGFEILGRAVETDPERYRYLTEAVAAILVQLGGGPNFEGWPQLGGRTVVDALAAIGEHLGIAGFDTKAGK